MQLFLPKHIKLNILLLFVLLGQIHAVAQAVPLSLDSCLALAISNSTQIKNAELEVQMAQETRNAARTKYFPNISASAISYAAINPLVELGVDDLPNAALRDLLHSLYYQNPLLLQGLNKNVELFQQGSVVSVSAIQPIYAGGRIITGNALAKIGIDAAQLQAQLQKNNILLATEESYWQFISLQEKTKVLSQVKNLLDTAYNNVNSALKAGLTTQNDMLQVRLKRNEINSTMLTLNNGLRLAKMALCQSIGIPYSDTIELADTLNVTMSPLEYYIPSEQITPNRTEAKLLDLAVQAEKLQYRMILGEALPQIGIGAAYMFNDLLFDKNSHNGLFFASIQIPLTSWWETGHNLKKQRLKQEIAENNQRDLTQKLSLQNQQIWDELEASYQQVLLADENVEFARENSKLAQVNYKAGMLSMAELMQTQTLLTQALDQQADMKIAYKIKLIHYRQLMSE